MIRLLLIVITCLGLSPLTAYSLQVFPAYVKIGAGTQALTIDGQQIFVARKALYDVARSPSTQAHDHSFKGPGGYPIAKWFGATLITNKLPALPQPLPDFLVLRADGEHQRLWPLKGELPERINVYCKITDGYKEEVVALQKREVAEYLDPALLQARLQREADERKARKAAKKAAREKAKREKKALEGN